MANNDIDEVMVRRAESHGVSVSDMERFAALEKAAEQAQQFAGEGRQFSAASAADLARTDVRMLGEIRDLSLRTQALTEIGEVGRAQPAYQAALQANHPAIANDVAEEQSRLSGLEAAKEAGKALDAQQFHQERIDRASAWTAEQAATQAGRDVAQQLTEPDPTEKYYHLADMAANAGANAAYREAVEKLSPDLGREIQQLEAAGSTLAVDAGQDRTSDVASPSALDGSDVAQLKSAIQEDIDHAALLGIEARAEQLEDTGMTRSVDVDRQTAHTDVQAFITIEGVGARESAAVQMASNARDFPDYKAGLDEASSHHPDLADEVAALDAASSAKVAAKEDRKTAAFEATLQHQREQAAAWSPEVAAQRAAFDASELGKEADTTERFYMAADMALRADANPHYRSSLEAASPELSKEVTAAARPKEQALVDLDRVAAARARDSEQARESLGLGTTAAAAGAGVLSARAAQLVKAMEGEGRKAATAMASQAAEDQNAARRGPIEENTVGLEATGKELQRSDVVMPRRIVQSYNEVDGKFFTKDANRLAFEDRADKLVTSADTKETIADMVAVAKAKQWQGIKLSGSIEFRREAWLQAESQGIKTQGYTPKGNDLAQLQALTQDRATNAITPLRERAQTQQREPSAGTQAPRHDLNKNQAVLHAEATKNLTTNLRELSEKPAFKDRAPDEMARLAYWRGIVREENRDQPSSVRDEVMARFDRKAEDPQFAAKLDRETRASMDDKTKDRVQTRETSELTR